MQIGDFANPNPPSSRLGRLELYLKEVSLHEAPIDEYWQTVSGILKYGTQDRLNSAEFLGPLLLLGVVSACEGYVRSILSGCLEQCPICRSHASKQQVHLGGLLWHGQAGFSRSAFEHSSFSSKDEIKSAFSKYLNVELKDTEFKAILDEFDNVCQLRHGIVHVDRLLPGRNAVNLDIPRYNKPVRISITFAQLQNAADVVTTLVYSLNRLVFEKMTERWSTTWRTRADWDPIREIRLFGEVWSLFVSSRTVESSGKDKISLKRQCRRLLKSKYNF